MKRITALLLTLALAGCATQYRYHKPGVSLQQHHKDDYECRQEATYSQSAGMLYGGQGLASGQQTVNQDMLFRCLQARGYTVTIE